MSKPGNYDKLASLVKSASAILVLQPDSPDGDSLGSALGLEEILGDLGKTVYMYSYKEPEPYLRNLEGWDRVSQNFPKSFDLTILVDTGAPALIKSVLEHHHADLTKHPFIVIDHHTSRLPFGFETIDIVEPAAAAAEVITQICQDLKWTINKPAATKLATALLSDSLNLTTPDSTAHSVEMLSVLVRCGANLYEMYAAKKEATALNQNLLHLKGKLLTQVQFLADGELAVLELTPDIVAAYKDDYEPYTLVLTEMQWVRGVRLAAVFKNYGTKINVPLRSKEGLAGPVAETFGGGGHLNAAAYRCKSTNAAAEIQALQTAYLKIKGSK
jgi:bifunctional oligoribonuclease and PAP phosphatase NrnA